MLNIERRKNMRLNEEIVDLISSGKEGGYWDFKKKWHKNKAELLLDIICMANNQVDRNAYIIFGVEDKTMKIIGVENDENRYNKSTITQFIKGKHFASYKPEVDLETFKICNHDIDVLIVKNTSQTPYFMISDFSDTNLDQTRKNKTKVVQHGVIYARLNDCKVGVDNSAPFEVIEYLWKKRFGIDKSINERYSLYLNEYDKWVCDWENNNYAYHNDHPEFQIISVGEMQNGWVPEAAFYDHPNFHFKKVNFMYHNTIIFNSELWIFNNFRKYLPIASRGSIKVGNKSIYRFSYYLLDTVEGRFLKILTVGSEININRSLTEIQILLFENDAEKKSFERYFIKNIESINENEIKVKYQHEITQEMNEIDNVGNFSVIHIAIASKLYAEWKSNNFHL
ncbi:MAG: ATP-binding protein [Erysipelotrichaceae bacterium]